MTKDDIRKETLMKRNLLTKDEITHKSRMIFDKLCFLEEYNNAQDILIYASMGSEVITDNIILDCIAKGKNVFCPKVTDKKNREMKFYRIEKLDDLMQGFYGIREPSENPALEYNDSENSSLVIMPGVAFDKNNNRIGYKGGFYDRFLSRNPSLKTVALAFKEQISQEDIPAEMHDIRPDNIITD